MTVLYILNVPENQPIAEAASRQLDVMTVMVGPYFEISAAGTIEVGRRVAGCRHAVWYSGVAGVRDGTVTKHDKDVLRIEPA